MRNAKESVVVFWSNVRKTGTCWIWAGPKRVRNYGQIWVAGKRVLAHRFSWEIHNGRRPRRHVLHSCDNERCVNPKHLREGSPKDNSKDAVQRNRYPHGENNHCAKLTRKDVIEVRRRRAAGEGVRALAREFGIDSSNLSKICKRKKWRRV